MSFSVQSKIGDIRIESLPLMQCTSLSDFTENSSSLILRFVLRFVLRSISALLQSSNSSRLPLNFLFDTSTSCLFARLALSSLRMPIKVTLPAPAVSLKSAQHHLTRIVGSMRRSTARWYMLKSKCPHSTEGYSFLINLIKSGGSTLVGEKCPLNNTPAIFVTWYNA